MKMLAFEFVCVLLIGVVLTLILLGAGAFQGLIYRLFNKGDKHE